MTIWLSPNGVEHAVDVRGRCATCGRRHEPQESDMPTYHSPEIDALFARAHDRFATTAGEIEGAVDYLRLVVALSVPDEDALITDAARRVVGLRSAADLDVLATT